MDHGINNEYLYTAKKISVEFTDDLGNKQSCSGTGFIVIKDNRYYFITNRHMVEYDYKKEQGSTYKLTGLTLFAKHFISNFTFIKKLDISKTIIKYPDNIDNDIACFEITNIFVNDGEKCSGRCITYEQLADQDFFNKLNVFDFVGFPNFSTYFDKGNNNPIFCGGILASDPRMNYSNNIDVKGDCLVYETLSFSGASGSPVFSTQRGARLDNKSLIYTQPDYFREVKCIGINAGHFTEKGSHSGISYFYKSYEILKLIDSYK